MSSDNDNNTKRVGLKSQLVLALIPSFISQMIAFYRIKKVFYGVIVEVVIFFIALVINLAISWPAGMIIALPITVGVPTYYIRKWTLEFNRENKGLFR
ncbi:hypothetical protein DYY67_1668 [Candidatus Nitrosotalea sp. TS]|uniref:hypothetical protein n=1 Tax=Candidatus Nitrosotalea sp. TS TaxID=2341020 RepID=UPI0014096FC3|nr:hypothetical protein [Candidatus Nitrosotalea sp. TS]NHI03356.1 hypothetical protein [Candidatus Nitrosotalea sp. TS]